MGLPEVIEEALGVFVDAIKALGWSALAIFGSTLALVGAIDLKGWTAQDIISDYTPFLLGLFSIGLTLYLFQKNIREGRERATHERNASVRPILIMEGKKIKSDTMVKHRQCFASSPTPEGELTLGTENAGLGAALNIEMYILCSNSKHYRMFPDTHKLAPSEQITLRIQYSLPSKIRSIVTKFEDVYGNLHFCEHGIDEEETGALQVFKNRYLSLPPAVVEAMDDVFSGRHLSQEAYIAEKMMERIRENKVTTEYTSTVIRPN